MIILILILIAAILFALATLPKFNAGINLVPAGLFFIALSMLVPLL